MMKQIPVLIHINSILQKQDWIYNFSKLNTKEGSLKIDNRDIGHISWYEIITWRSRTQKQTDRQTDTYKNLEASLTKYNIGSK